MRARGFKVRLAAAALAIAVAPIAMGAFSTVFSSDFEGGIGAEWSTGSTTNDPVFSRFLGRFGNGAITFTQNTSVGEQYRLTFDLYLIDRWRGDQGNDLFTLSLDGATIFSDTFDNSGGVQTYPDAPTVGGANLGFANQNDSIYRSISFVFNAAGAQSIVAFGAAGLPNNTNNASWGVDNVTVEQWIPVIPAPGSQALAGVGLILLLCARPLRRESMAARPRL